MTVAPGKHLAMEEFAQVEQFLSGVVINRSFILFVLQHLNIVHNLQYKIFLESVHDTNYN